MNGQNLQRFAISVFILLSFLLLSIVVLDIAQRDLGPDFSSAIYGGKLESGYPEVGYMTAFEGENSVFTCGLSFISNDIALTAAHCIKQNSTIYVGENQFKLQPALNVEAQDATQHPNWDGEDRGFDVGLIKLESSTQFNDFIEIVEPEVGCNYEIVGYGGTEVDQLLESDQKLRKSYEICIEAATTKLLYLRGPEGGVCFGDSGSPILVKGTNQVVGVLSAVFPSEQDPNVFCEIGNNAVAARVSNVKDFIDSYSQGNLNSGTSLALCGESCVGNSCSSGLVCNASRVCQLRSGGGCIATEGSFCSVVENITCPSDNSCVLNECVKKADVENFSNSSFNVNLSSDFLSTNRNTLIAVIVGLLAIDFFFITLISVRRLFSRV